MPGPGAPRLLVPASPILRGDPVPIRAEGLTPGAAFRLEAEGQDQHGQWWRSRAEFTADAAGTLDAARDAPTSGSWAGPSPFGSLWSMALDPSAAVVTPMVSIDRVGLSLRDAGGTVVARGAIALTDSAGISEIPVANPIRGSLFAPSSGEGPRPPLLVLGGSEGGCRRDLAAALASRLRVPVLALAYFGVPGSNLPATLQEIPLEYFAGALDWLATRPEVRAGPVAVLGISRGAELALLLASTYPGRILGVAANVPSAVTWQGEGAPAAASSWTVGGVPVPFVPTTMDADLLARFQAAIRERTPFAFREVYSHSLAQAPVDRIAAATIPVERIGGPVMLLGSGLDGVWPSAGFVSRIAERLERSGFGFPVERLVYPSSGHLIQCGSQPTTLGRHWLPSMGLFMDLGGTPAGSAAANADSWPRLTAFLDSLLR